ncbi:MAG: hypothetical protein WBN75_16700 [Verrucomicrobiia bacterium]
MSQILDFKCSAQLPVAKMAKLVLWQAIEGEADHIIFELDLQAHKEIKAEREDITKAPLVDIKKFPKAFQITLKSGETEKKLSLANGYLFEPVMRVLFGAAEIPYWKKGEDSAELETANPSSKWMIESKDLTQRIQLQRIRAT